MGRKATKLGCVLAQERFVLLKYPLNGRGPEPWSSRRLSGAHSGGGTGDWYLPLTSSRCRLRKRGNFLGLPQYFP
jgi:hypothetical protein